MVVMIFSTNGSLGGRPGWHNFQNTFLPTNRSKTKPGSRAKWWSAGHVRRPAYKIKIGAISRVFNNHLSEKHVPQVTLPGCCQQIQGWKGAVHSFNMDQSCFHVNPWPANFKPQHASPVRWGLRVCRRVRELSLTRQPLGRFFVGRWML